ncbi:SDR family oxidoreductase [uncultured Alsobacter sp.]|uniref:SDR family NAD(P)-dependent oxidoreductase n=1 Tax=uncultured Alsobacter sp. TaxID=1748258 RepID=UPI0025D04A6C|nr:SDR family oxidoreductase [uncultured Alsobacter sp.]
MTQLPRTPSFRLDGRRALITGAGRGLGLAAAAALAEAGAHVVLAARTRPEIEAAARAIVERGGSAEPLVLDVLDVTAVRQTLAAAEPFHVLVNNAGTNRPRPMTDITTEDFDAVMDLNVRAAYFVAQTVAARMVSEAIAGSIINISSQMGHVGWSKRTVYCASKHAIEGLTKAMAVEFGAAGIRVNTVGPTFIVTEMTRPYFEDAAFRDAVLGKIKLGRLGEVEDVMGPILFLASDASAMITGTALLVDGGWTAD